MPNLPAAGAPFPKVSVPTLGGGDVTLGQSEDWALVIVYRGLHCPKCKAYMEELDGLLGDFKELGVSVTCVSADTKDKAQAFVDEVGYTGTMAYGLSVDQMREMGVYISAPLSAAEADAPFAEPALFVVNDEGVLHLQDVSTMSWGRPPLMGVRDGINFVRTNNRPPRGTY